MKKRLAVIATVIVTLGAASVGIAIAGADDDATQTPITGTDLQRASEAALDHTRGGRVTGTEVGDEESYYEVEVTLHDGGQVDVQLDKSFNVVSSSGDHDGSAED